MIVANIKKLCEKEGIAISELEKRVAISNGTIRRWDQMNPRTDKIKAVADYFGVTVDELLRAPAQEGSNEHS